MLYIFYSQLTTRTHTLFKYGAITLIEDQRIALKCLKMLQIRVREREHGANGNDVTILIG